MPEYTARRTLTLADRYRIEHHVGEGGVDTVCLAEDRTHRSTVAAKVLHSELWAMSGGERFPSRSEVISVIETSAAGA